MSTDSQIDPLDLPFHLAAGPTHTLLVPGYMGTPKEMRPLAEALAADDISARGVLLPGFEPDSARLAEAGSDEWMDVALKAWLEIRPVAERTVLIGFSMGGAVALKLAALAPPDALVLLAPHWRFADKRALALPLVKGVMKQFQPFGNADFSDPTTRKMFAEMEPNADLDDPTTQAQLRNKTALPTRSLDEVRKIGAAAGTAARHVKVPTTILQGRDDTTSLPIYTRLLALRLAGPLSLHELPGGHQLVDPALPPWETIRAAVVAAAVAVARR